MDISSDRGAVFFRLALVIAVCLTAGLLLAGLVFPIVGGFGLLARAGADSFNSMPAELDDPPPPQRSKILAADGSTLADVYFNENRVLVSLDRVPENCQRAIIAIEDERFYEHGGVDVRGLLRAFIRNSQAGGVTQGGSTITQQYVKNVLIELADDSEGKKAAVERSTARKVREARYAIAMERKYTKRQILEKYLNIAYYGDGVYGIGTAAQHYYGKPVERLSLGECALLAGLVKNPRFYDPTDNPKNALARRNTVLKRMNEVAFVTHREHLLGMREPLRVIKAKPLTGIEDNTLAPAFLDYVRSEILADNRFGPDEKARAATLFQGGLTIRTTLDPRLQAVANNALRATLGRPTDPASAAVVIKPGTGEVKAMAVLNHDKNSRKVNLALGGAAGFQAGSLFKPFVLASAIEQGIPVKLALHSPQRYVSRIYKTSDRYGRTVPYAPENSGDSQAGIFDMASATWHSVNTYFVQLQERTGIEKPMALTKRMGVTRFPLKGGGSFVLGASEVSPLDMANSYATLAARGLACKPMAITEVRHADGSRLGDFRRQCAQVMEPAIADTVTSLLEGVLTQGTGTGARIGRPAAGKTGTTNGPSAAWFDGYTPDFAAAVWVGYPKDPTKRPLRNIHGVRVVYGGTFPATMWRLIMTEAHRGLPPKPFPVPPASVIAGHQVAVPDLVGYEPEDAIEALTALGLMPVVDVRRVAAGPVPVGYVGATSPAAGAMLTAGSRVVIFLSNGMTPPPPSPTPSASVSPSGSPKPTPSVSPSRLPSPTPSPTPSPSPSPTPTPTPSPTCTPSPQPSGKCPKDGGG